MDKMKDYLQQHCSGLDVDVPGESVWERLSQNSLAPLPRRITTRRILRYVAAACLAGILLTVAWRLLHQDKQKERRTMIVSADTTYKKPVTARPATEIPVAVVPKKVNRELLFKTKRNFKNLRPASMAPENMAGNKNIKNIAPELAAGYEQLVAYQLRKIRRTPLLAGDPEYFSDFRQQLKLMETDEAAIRKEIKLNGINEVLLEQLINVCQQKLTLLKTIQLQMNQMNNRVKQQQAPGDSTITHYLNI